VRIVAAFSADSRWVAYVDYNQAHSPVRVLALENLAAPLTGPRFTFPITGEVRALAFRPDGQELAVTTASAVHLLTLGPSAPATAVLPLQEVYTSVYLPDGRLATVQEKAGVVLWTRAGETWQRQTLPGPGVDFPYWFGIAASPTGDRLAVDSNSWRNHIAVWDLIQPAARPVVVTTTYEPRSLAFSPDGAWLAVGTNSGDRMVQLFATRALDTPPRILQTGTTVTTLAFSPDGRRLVAGTSREGLWLWDITDWDAPAVQLQP
jgi:WD40 repeat protein